MDQKNDGISRVVGWLRPFRRGAALWGGIYLGLMWSYWVEVEFHWELQETNGFCGVWRPYSYSLPFLFVQLPAFLHCVYWFGRKCDTTRTAFRQGALWWGLTVGPALVVGWLSLPFPPIEGSLEMQRQLWMLGFVYWFLFAALSLVRPGLWCERVGLTWWVGARRFLTAFLVPLASVEVPLWFINLNAYCSTGGAFP